MRLFLDASAIVAILAVENGFEELAARVDAADESITSPLAMWEAVRGLSRDRAYSFEAASRKVSEFLSQNGIGCVQLSEREAELALEAHATYGKGNHRARLNMGDCFASACAKANGATLLYKGDDFARTDLA